MDDGVTKGSNIAVVLVIVAALIAVAFGIFVVTKNQANVGSADLSSSLNTVATQIFQDFDQKIVSGNQVLSALKSFEGKPYAVLISTTALATGFPIAQEADHPTGFFVNAGSRVYLNYNAVLSADGVDVTSSGGINWASVTGVNALPGGTRIGNANNTDIRGLTGAVIDIPIENGVYLHTAGFQTVDGNIHYDNAIGGATRSGSAEFIQSTTKFQSNLVKDASGSYVGVVLRQL